LLAWRADGIFFLDHRYASDIATRFGYQFRRELAKGPVPDFGSIAVFGFGFLMFMMFSYGAFRALRAIEV
jgi:hypothetical protein